VKRSRSSIAQRINCLAICPLFANISESDLKSLAPETSFQVYEAGETIFFQGRPAEVFYIVAQGRLKVFRTNPEGRQQILHLMGPGEPCGEVPVFQGADYPATAEAVEETTVCRIPRDKFLAFGKRRPEILLDMLAMLSIRLRHFVNLVDDLSLKEVSARLAGYLLEISDRAGGASEIRLNITKATLANRLGTIAETLSRTLANMQKQGMIQVHGRTISRLDHEKLRVCASGLKA